MERQKLKIVTTCGMQHGAVAESDTVDLIIHMRIIARIYSRIKFVEIIDTRSKMDAIKAYTVSHKFIATEWK